MNNLVVMVKRFVEVSSQHFFAGRRKNECLDLSEVMKTTLPVLILFIAFIR